MKSLLFTLILTAITAMAQNYSLSTLSLTSGGGTSAGGTFSLIGEIGGPDAINMTGGTYSLQGALWDELITIPEGDGPALRIQRLGRNVTISWPLSATGFVLQAADNYNLRNWNALTLTPQQVN